MGYDYDALYQKTPHALGEPTSALVDFFKESLKPPLSILDLGCGQGRDALFLARAGHRVFGVDLSAAGIAQLLEVARAEGLSIDGCAADICAYVPEEKYDVVLADRTLHMLSDADRASVFDRMLGWVKKGGYLIIADERKNLTQFQNILDDDPNVWQPLAPKKGMIFARFRAPSAA